MFIKVAIDMMEHEYEFIKSQADKHGMSIRNYTREVLCKGAGIVNHGIVSTNKMGNAREFVEEGITLTHDWDEMVAIDIHGCYLKWCDGCKQTPLGKKNFYRVLEEGGLRRIRKNNMVCFTGGTLNDLDNE